MTGLKYSEARRMMCFWMAGTFSGGTSTPRSPRAMFNVFRKGLEGGADERGGAGNIARRNGEALAGFEHYRIVIFQLRCADLGALQVAEDTERLVLFAADFANHLDESQLLFVG